MSYYSPHTFEHIQTDNPADWMGRASKPAPDYDPAMESAFWRQEIGEWEVVKSNIDHPPSYKTFTSLGFLDLFTEAEQLAVAEAALQSAQVKLWYDRLLAASYITLSDPRVEAGLSSLVEAGLLTSDRRIEIVKAMQ